jgi:catechol 2,3-dioxygenase-like lactoylglutathione lyase family enzyme
MTRLVGINHVALEVDSIDEALAWYGRFLEFELRGRAGDRMAFIDAGDQFIALAAGRTQPSDAERHFGLVVDDKEAIRAALRREGVDVAPAGSLDFRDPWGNHIQVVDYRDIRSPRRRRCSAAWASTASRSRPTRWPSFARRAWPRTPQPAEAGAITSLGCPSVIARRRRKRPLIRCARDAVKR